MSIKYSQRTIKCMQKTSKIMETVILKLIIRYFSLNFQENKSITFLPWVLYNF